jgi:hypothetical protein
MQLTRLHIILLIIVISIISLYIAQYIQNKTKIKKMEIGKIEQPIQPVEISSPVAQVPKEIDKSIANTTIAVAGEYMKLSKKENKDVKKGQIVLREAKKQFEIGNYSRAYYLAKQSIEEFKSAKIVEIHPAVKIKKEFKSKTFTKKSTKHGKYYTVKHGDCLWNISKMPQHYGRGSMWVKIWRANESKIPDFDIIYSGQILVIP